MAQFDYTNVPDKATGDTVLESDWDTMKDSVNDLMTPSRAQVSINSNQSITNDVLTTVTWDVEDHDNDSMVDIGTNDDRITVARAGWYDLYFFVQWAATGGLDGERIMIAVTLNGTTNEILGNESSSEVAQQYLSGYIPYEFAAEDYIVMRALQTGAAARNLEVARMGVRWTMKS